jgi:hypothetical protein
LLSPLTSKFQSYFVFWIWVWFLRIVLNSSSSLFFLCWPSQEFISVKHESSVRYTTRHFFHHFTFQCAQLVPCLHPMFASQFIKFQILKKLWNQCVTKYVKYQQPILSYTYVWQQKLICIQSWRWARGLWQITTKY